MNIVRSIKRFCGFTEEAGVEAQRVARALRNFRVGGRFITTAGHIDEHTRTELREAWENTYKGEKTMKPWDITKEKYDEAIKLSDEHHEDGAHRTEETYRDFKLGSEDCALCGLFEDSCTAKASLCPLHDVDSACCAEWRESKIAYRRELFPDFHKAELALCNRIRNLPSYDEWFAEKVKGMVREYNGKKYRYTGDFRAVNMGEYHQTKDSTRILRDGFGHEPEYPCHILEPVDEGKGASKLFGIPSCDTCAHEYTPEAKTKYAVGKHVWWYGEGLFSTLGSTEQAQEVEIVEYDNNKDTMLPYRVRTTRSDSDASRWVQEKSLCPLPAKTKYAVGKHVWWDGTVYDINGGIVAQEKPQEVVIESLTIHPYFDYVVADGWRVHANQLSPLPAKPKVPKFKAGDIITGGSGKQYMVVKIIEGEDYCLTLRSNEDQTRPSRYCMNRLATPEEALAYWLEKATVERNGVKLRAYEDGDGEIGDGYTIIYMNDAGKLSCEGSWKRSLTKALDLPIIPVAVSKGNFEPPE